MACAYCGKEVPFRMRLTGEDHFCSLSHKRLYHDEHSRIGLARLLEEVSAEPVVEPPPPGIEPVPTDDVPDAGDEVEVLPEPELVYSGQGLKLWTFPYERQVFTPRFDHLASAGLVPADYTPGAGITPEPKKNDEVERVSPASVPDPPEMSFPDSSAASENSTDGADAVESAGNRVVDDPDSEDKQTGQSERPFADEAVELEIFQSVEPSAAGGYKIAAGVALALCLGAGGYLGLGIGGGSSSDTVATRSSDSVLDEWIPNWSDADVDGGIALFGPSREWSDYRVQWSAESKKDLTWVFRAADARNYYAVQIETAATGGLRLLRYTVVEGERSEEVESALALPDSGERKLAVELEVRGSRFVLYLEGRSVAEWSDDRLPVGGFGVVRPDVGLAEVDDVKVIPLSGHSATTRRFWTGLPPDTMPEVTVLPPVHKSTQESEEL